MFQFILCLFFYGKMLHEIYIFINIFQKTKCFAHNLLDYYHKSALWLYVQFNFNQLHFFSLNVIYKELLLFAAVVTVLLLLLLLLVCCCHKFIICCIRDLICYKDIFLLCTVSVNISIICMIIKCAQILIYLFENHILLFQ